MTQPTCGLDEKTKGMAINIPRNANFDGLFFTSNT
jgi:hypothetical protein